MIPWPYALACMLCAVAWAVWLLWRQRLQRRALHEELDHVNAALQQWPLLGVMPDKQPVDDAMRAQADAFATYLRLQQKAYKRWCEEAAQERARAEDAPC